MARGSDLKEIEEFPRRIKVFFFVIIFLLTIGTLSFKIITNASIEDSFMRTIETLAFIFEDDSSLGERLIEIILAIVGVFLIWWVLWSIADMLLDGNLTKYLKTKYYSVIIRNMKNHIIIVGGGRVGEEAAKVLLSKKQKYIVIDIDENVARSLMKKKYNVIQGDASQESFLKQAGIGKASKILLTLPKTETNILITLTAKELNPSIEVYSRCEKASLVSKLKRAGAKVVVIPEIMAGDTLAESLGV